MARHVHIHIHDAAGVINSPSYERGQTRQLRASEKEAFDAECKHERRAKDAKGVMRCKDCGAVVADKKK